MTMMDAGTSTTAGCTNDMQCPPGQACELATGMCVMTSTTACDDNRPCGPGRDCVDGACEPTTCTDHADCDGWVCDNGLCVEPMACGPMGMCPDGLFCDNGLCVPAPAEGCDRDDQCTDPQICVFNECVDAIECMSSAECPAELRCQDGECREPCMQDSDCPSRRFTCDMNTGECQARCFGDRTCPDGQICESLLCVPAECTMDSECDTANDEECQGADNGHGRCEEVERCMNDSECPENFFCDPMGTCRELPRCAGDRACEDDEFCDDGHCQPSMSCAMTGCPMDQECIADRCVPGGCRGPADCPTAGEICVAGRCEPPPPPTFITEVRIVTPAGVVRPNTTYRFTAIALNQSGAVVPGVTFAWVSTSTQVASIDTTGLATGHERSGTTSIIATADTGAGLVSSAPVLLTNLGALTAGDVRITALDLASGSAVAGAQVELSSAGFGHSTMTSATGVATVTGVPAGAALTVTIAHASYDYVSLIGVGLGDYVVPMPTLTTENRVAGLKGTIDMSMVTSTGNLGYSISGGSFTSPLFTFDARAFFGNGNHNAPVMIPGGMSFNVPVAANATLEAEVFGTPFTLKSDYYATARQGVRAAWSFGGRVDFDIFRGGGGGGGPGDILGATLPYFQRFQHAVRPAVVLRALPRVMDANDIDNDNDTTELVPDFNNFPGVPLAPSVDQSLRYQLNTGNARLPFVTGGNANTLLVITGAVVPGVGFVPLGLDGLSDNGGNGLVAPFTSRMAPPHSGLEVGRYAVLATAFRSGMRGPDGPGSTQLVIEETLPATVDISSGWLDSPVGAAYDRGARSLNVPVVMGVDMVHTQIQGTDGAWHLYFAPTADPVAIPAAPMGAMDRVASATITANAIDLDGTSFEGLFDVAAGGVTALDGATKRFARSPVTHQ